MNYVMVFLSGAVLAAACVIAVDRVWDMPDSRLIQKCKHRVVCYHALSEHDKAVWRARCDESSEFKLRWEATCLLNNHFGGEPIAIPK